MLKICLGGLGWSPDQFWQSGVLEVFHAIDGWEIITGRKAPPPDVPNADFMTKMMERFPDNTRKKTSV